jgi:hypothetical protein
MSVKVGEVYGYLTVIELGHRDSSYKPACLCKCKCGASKIVRCSRLPYGDTISCGCATGVKGGRDNTHNMRYTRTYQIWAGMVKRCTNPKCNIWNHYGGRGITIDPRWLKFENFFEDMGEAPIGYQIDRIDNDGNYTKINCRWVTQRTNINNRTRRTV